MSVEKFPHDDEEAAKRKINTMFPALAARRPNRERIAHLMPDDGPEPIDRTAATIAGQVAVALGPTLQRVIGFSNSRGTATIEAEHIAADGSKTMVRVTAGVETGQR